MILKNKKFMNNTVKYNKFLFSFGIIFVLLWFVVNGLLPDSIIGFLIVIVGLGLLLVSQWIFFMKVSKNQLQNEPIIYTYFNYLILLSVGKIIDFLFKRNFEISAYLLLGSYSLYVLFFIVRKLVKNEKFIWY